MKKNNKLGIAMGMAVGSAVGGVLMATMTGKSKNSSFGKKANKLLRSFGDAAEDFLNTLK